MLRYQIHWIAVFDMTYSYFYSCMFSHTWITCTYICLCVHTKAYIRHWKVFTIENMQKFAVKCWGTMRANKKTVYEFHQNIHNAIFSVFFISWQINTTVNMEFQKHKYISATYCFTEHFFLKINYETYQMSFVSINYAQFMSVLLKKKKNPVTESTLQTRCLRSSLASECFVSPKVEWKTDAL